MGEDRAGQAQVKVSGVLGPAVQGVGSLECLQIGRQSAVFTYGPFVVCLHI